MYHYKFRHKDWIRQKKYEEQQQQNKLEIIELEEDDYSWYCSEVVISYIYPKLQVYRIIKMQILFPVIITYNLIYRWHFCWLLYWLMTADEIWHTRNFQIVWHVLTYIILWKPDISRYYNIRICKTLRLKVKGDVN